MRLHKLHPDLPNCGACEKYLFTRDWKPVARKGGKGEQAPRPKGTKPPCNACPKCFAESQPSPAMGKANEISTKNKRTLRLYYEAQAGCVPPEVLADPIVRQNFGVLFEQLQAIDRELLSRTMMRPMLAILKGF